MTNDDSSFLIPHSCFFFDNTNVRIAVEKQDRALDQIQTCCSVATIEAHGLDDLIEFDEREGPSASKPDVDFLQGRVAW